MTNNVYGIDLGTCNMKIYCKSSNKILNEKNTIALKNKDEIYAYGNSAYAMYEKAPESIHVTFPVINWCHRRFQQSSVHDTAFLRNTCQGKLKGGRIYCGSTDKYHRSREKSVF